MVWHATQTYKAINETMIKDQGGSFRQWEQRVLPHMGDAYRGQENPFRNHLGASVIGGECGRAVWYGFRWFTLKKFDGRLLRLFNRGHLEEARIISMLLMIGCKVYQQDENGKQFAISDCYGHFGGSGDGVVVGLPDLKPDTAALLECKTHSDKSFKELTEKGMRGAKWEHYVQMQVYMRKMGLYVGLYVAVNKNNDELHMEIVQLDTETADKYIERARTVIFMREPPKKLNESPGFWKCKFCDYKPVCHNNAAPSKNCRTCIHSVPIQDGSKLWGCELHKKTLDVAAQYAACDDYKAI